MALMSTRGSAAAAQPAGRVVARGGLEVRGCGSDESIGQKVRGIYAAHGENHGRPVYRRGRQDAFLYYWDTRDGENFSGWWMGPSVGADLVFAHCPCSTQAPPAAGWCVPFGGSVDTTLVVCAIGAATVAGGGQQPGQKRAPDLAGSAAPSKRGAHLQRQQLQPQHHQLARAQLTPRQPEEAEKKRADGAEIQREAETLRPTRLAIQKIRSATPDNFEMLKAELDEMLTQDLPKCSPEVANALFEEADKHVEFARQRIHRMEEQQRMLEKRAAEIAETRELQAAKAAETKRVKDEDLADPSAPPMITVPQASVGRLIGQGGATLKMLVAETGCKIDVAGNNSGATATVRFAGQACGRRVAREAVELIIDGGDAEDVRARARGAIVIPHGLQHPGRLEWLRWLAPAVQLDVGCEVEVTKNTLRLLPKAGAPDSWKNGGCEQRTAVQGLAETLVADAQAVAELSLDVGKDHGPEQAAISACVRVFADQHGVLAKPLDPEDDVVPILALGPPSAARDAAAVLWARFKQGKATAVIPVVHGQLEAMDKLMRQDFARDLQAVRDETGVEVTEGETSVWMAGAESKVADTRATLQEMLAFYMPDDFLLLAGLQTEGLESARRDPELLAAARDEQCAFAVDPAEGEAWVCGPRKGSAAAAAWRRIEELARPGGASAEAIAAQTTAAETVAAATAPVEAEVA